MSKNISAFIVEASTWFNFNYFFLYTYIAVGVGICSLFISRYCLFSQSIKKVYASKEWNSNLEIDLLSHPMCTFVAIYLTWWNVMLSKSWVNILVSDTVYVKGRIVTFYLYLYDCRWTVFFYNCLFNICL